MAGWAYRERPFPATESRGEATTPTLDLDSQILRPHTSQNDNFTIQNGNQTLLFRHDLSHSAQHHPPGIPGELFLRRSPRQNRDERHAHRLGRAGVHL